MVVFDIVLPTSFNTCGFFKENTFNSAKKHFTLRVSSDFLVTDHVLYLRFIGKSSIFFYLEE